MNTPEDPEPMIKEGVVRKGKTPSVVSGKPSEEVRFDKEAYAIGEPDVGSLDDIVKEMCE